MSRTTFHEHDRLLELLADRAVGDIADPDARELDALLADAAGFDDACMDRAAAALGLAMLDDAAEYEELPASLRSSLITSAQTAFERTPARPTTATRAPAVREAAPVAGRIGFGPTLGWVAAAACLLIAVVAWMRPGVVIEPAGPPSFEQLAMQDDVIRVEWAAQDDPAAEGATGEVVWSDDAQYGYMVFRGLAALDPSEQQYQLWIFDPSRPSETPVDGGVFDIPPGQDEVVVPIHAKLPVRSPSLFAVTIEKPGGVVVSKRERLPLAAPVGQG
ncbi:MAG: anti-sigma factor [Planctomycetota bacterium]|nr:anti-sigma factor [Planctomycetota bacterium]